MYRWRNLNMYVDILLGFRKYLIIENFCISLLGQILALKSVFLTKKLLMYACLDFADGTIVSN